MHCVYPEKGDNLIQIIRPNIQRFLKTVNTIVIESCRSHPVVSNRLSSIFTQKPLIPTTYVHKTIIFFYDKRKTIMLC